MAESGPTMKILIRHLSRFTSAGVKLDATRSEGLRRDSLSDRHAERLRRTAP